MMIRIFVSDLLASGINSLCLAASAAWARNLLTGTYSLDRIVALAIKPNHALAGAEEFVRQSHEHQIAAGLYPNPSLSGTAGHGIIYDPGTGIRITRCRITHEQSFEWIDKRQARPKTKSTRVAGSGGRKTSRPRSECSTEPTSSVIYRQTMRKDVQPHANRSIALARWERAVGTPL